MIAESADNNFWINNKSESFKLSVKELIKKKKYKKRHKKENNVGIMVFQNKQVGKRNYVWFRTFMEDGEQGYDLHFIMNNNGDVLDWIKSSFIF
jgi:hypothetical protein